MSPFKDTALHHTAQNQIFPEKELRGLFLHSSGDLQVRLEVARKKKEKFDWKLLLEKEIEREMLQGMPQVDIKYQNTDANEAALQK